MAQGAKHKVKKVFPRCLKAKFFIGGLKIKLRKIGGKIKIKFKLKMDMQMWESIVVIEDIALINK